MLKVVKYLGAAVRGRIRTVPATTRLQWLCTDEQAHGVRINSTGVDPTTGTVRVGLNVNAEAGAVGLHLGEAELPGNILVPIWQSGPVLIPYMGRERLEKVTIYNPSGTALDFAVTFLDLKELSSMEGWTPIVSTTIALTSGVADTIDWSALEGNEYGELITIATHSTGGSNATRVVHNGDGSPAAPTADGLGAVVTPYAFYPIPVGHNENIDTTDLIQSSGVALTLFVTKWRKA